MGESTGQGRDIPRKTTVLPARPAQTRWVLVLGKWMVIETAVSDKEGVLSDESTRPCSRSSAGARVLSAARWYLVDEGTVGGPTGGEADGGTWGVDGAHLGVWARARTGLLGRSVADGQH